MERKENARFIPFVSFASFFVPLRDNNLLTIDPTYFKYLIELDALIIHVVFFISYHCLDEIKDIFKRFISDKSSFVQKRESFSNSLVLFPFKKREE